MTTTPAHRFSLHISTVALGLALLAGCVEPFGYVQPEVPEVPIVTAAEAERQGLPSEVMSTPAAARPEVRVVAAKEAEARGLEGHVAYTAFGEGQDGTKLLVDFLDKARSRGAAFVSDVHFYFASSRDGRPVECRIGVHPVEAAVPVQVPGSLVPQSEMVPVTRTVTEQQYQCRSVMKPVTRTVTDYQNRCHSVMKPVMRTETTYTTQYDSFSKTTRTVPQTRTVTQYQTQNECRMEPVTRTVTEQQLQNDCRMEPVTRTVTRYEFQLSSRFVPPHVEYLRSHDLQESAPVCYELPGGDAGKGNRIEAKLYTRRGR